MILEFLLSIALISFVLTGLFAVHESHKEAEDDN